MLPARSALLVPLAALFATALTVGVGCKTLESSAKVDANEIAALKAMSYDDFEYVVSTYVDDHGKVKYANLLKDRSRLDQFVATLAVVGPKTRPELFPTDDAKLAYHINTYNALVMFNVLEQYPDIGTVYDSEGAPFFYLTKFKVDGGETNLYDIENKTIRENFKEPRIHFALNCASESCPRLPNHVFLPDTLQDQLHEETNNFLHDPRNVKVEGTTVTLSQIFEWYAEDFDPDAKSDPKSLPWIRAYARDLNIPNSAQEKFTPYDWKLNDQDR